MSKNNAVIGAKPKLLEEETVVGFCKHDGEPIKAENLCRWAYNRLEKTLKAEAEAASN